MQICFQSEIVSFISLTVVIGALSQTQVHPLLGSLSLPGRPLQAHPHGQLEHFLPLRVNSPSPLSLFPNFNAVKSILSLLLSMFVFCLLFICDNPVPVCVFVFVCDFVAGPRAESSDKPHVWCVPT